MLPAIMAKSASCIDPFFYAVTHPRFRKELEDFFWPAHIESGSNFQTSYYSRGPSTRRRTKTAGHCEVIEIGCHTNGHNNQTKPPLNRAESSFCDESVVSLEMEIKC